MANRFKWFFKQTVASTELVASQDALEQADRDFAVDMGVSGVVSGLVPTETTPTADLSVSISNGHGYDPLGRRVLASTGVVLDLSIDSDGRPTEPTTAGFERWVSVFVRSLIVLSDPRVDGASQPVFFLETESLEFVVRMGAEALIGAAVKPSLQPEEILLFDVLRQPGQTQLFNADFNTDRRQDLVFLSASAIQVDASSWVALSAASLHVQDALDDIDGLLVDHFGGTVGRHTAAGVDVTTGGLSFYTGADLQALVNASDTRLANHFSGTSEKHTAASIELTPTSWIGAFNVQNAFIEMTTDLGRQSPTVEGASLIGGSATTGSDSYNLAAGTVQAMLTSLITDIRDVNDSLINIDHHAKSDTDGGVDGSHRRINTDVRHDSDTRKLIQDIIEDGSVPHCRVYWVPNALFPAFEITLNAEWQNGSADWTPDTTSAPSLKWSLSVPNVNRGVMLLEIQDSTGVDWADSAWSQTMQWGDTGTTDRNVGTYGDGEDFGTVGLAGRMFASVNNTVWANQGITFKGYFFTAPSTVTLTLVSSASWATVPTVSSISTSGFRTQGTSDSVASNTACHWYGTYRAF